MSDETKVTPNLETVPMQAPPEQSGLGGGDTTPPAASTTTAVSEFSAEPQQEAPPLLTEAQAEANITPLPIEPKAASMMAAAAGCPHNDKFSITMDMQRTEHQDPKAEHPTTWLGIFTVRCELCKLPMCFSGIPVAGPREQPTGPHTDAIGLALRVYLRPGAEVFQHFAQTVGTAGAPIPTTIQPDAPPRAEDFLSKMRKGARKMVASITGNPNLGTRPVMIEGHTDHEKWKKEMGYDKPMNPDGKPIGTELGEGVN